jgi:hypothetical protein
MVTRRFFFAIAGWVALSLVGFSADEPARKTTHLDPSQWPKMTLAPEEAQQIAEAFAISQKHRLADYFVRARNLSRSEREVTWTFDFYRKGEVPPIPPPSASFAVIVHDGTRTAELGSVPLQPKALTKAQEASVPAIRAAVEGLLKKNETIQSVTFETDEEATVHFDNGGMHGGGVISVKKIGGRWVPGRPVYFL